MEVMIFLGTLVTRVIETHFCIPLFCTNKPPFAVLPSTRQKAHPPTVQLDLSFLLPKQLP